MIDLLKINLTAVGGAGTSTATAYSPHISGRILAVFVDYSAGNPATTDLTISDAEDPISDLIVNLANQAADIKLYPRKQVHTNAGVGLTYDGTRTVCEPYIVCGRLKAIIAQSNNNETASICIWFES